MKITDGVWEVIRTHFKTYKGVDIPDQLRDLLEKHTDIQVFDGGAFIAKDNEFDLFVVPEKRGRWRIRSIVGQYLDQMGRKHSRIVVKINERNTPSLRLARHFGFHEVSRENGVIRLEKDYGRYC